MVSWMRRRFGGSPLFPALLSFLVAPGLGQFANREYFKGSLLLFGFIATLTWYGRSLTEALSLFLDGPPEKWSINEAAFQSAALKTFEMNPTLFFHFYILLGLIWIFGAVDAYVTARKLRRPAAPMGDANERIDETGDADR